MGHRVGMALSVLAALLGWISYGHVALLLASDVLVSYWFTRRRALAAEGPVTRAGLKYARYGSVAGRSLDRELFPVQGEPLTLHDRKFVAGTTDAFVGVSCLFLVCAALVWDAAGLLASPLQVVVWLTLAGQLAWSEYQTHRDWLADDAHLTADPTRQGDRDVYASFLLAFVTLCLGGMLGAGRVAAAALTLTGALLDAWRRGDLQNPTRLTHK